MDSLESILKAEFANTPVVYGRDLPAQGTQWFRMFPASDVAEELGLDGEVRRYGVQLRYLILIGGRETKNSHITRLTSVGEHVKRLMANNRNYSPSGTYKFHDLSVENVAYDADPLEDESIDNISIVVWDISVSVGETF